MHARKGQRNTGTILKLAILAIFFSFTAQLTFAAYASAIPVTKADTYLYKDQGVKSAPQVNKSFKIVAHLHRATTLDLSTTSSSIVRLTSYTPIIRFHSKVPTRAPPSARS